MTTSHPPISRARRLSLGVILVGALASVGLTIPEVASAAPTDASSHASVRRPDPVAELAMVTLGDVIEVERNGNVSRAVSAMVQRSRLAAMVADRLGVDENALRTAWAKADADHQIALLAALSQLGVPYRTNADKPGIAFDCSGLTSFAWSVAGYEIPHQSTAQIRMATPVGMNAQAGDLVQYPGHVMMWLGVDNLIVHSPNSGDVVSLDRLSGRSQRRSRMGDPTG